MRKFENSVRGSKISGRLLDFQDSCVSLGSLGVPKEFCGFQEIFKDYVESFWIMGIIRIFQKGPCARCRIDDPLGSREKRVESSSLYVYFDKKH